ncbi:hypothetical protein P7L87_24305, partial [Vibrio parahaemolyticus]|nr:hypothetical protein [Vibrio parahaemolyticus]
GGWDEMRQRLKGQNGVPLLYVFETCKEFIRTVPSLPHDPRRMEDIDTSAEDHIADEARYACMSRPWVPVQDKPKTRSSSRDWFDERDDDDSDNWKTI